MSGQKKLSRLNGKYEVISSDTAITSKGWTYHCTTSGTHTLPDSSGLEIGDLVKFTKNIDALPIIQRFGASVQIKTAIGNDSSVLFDINAEIIFVWNGSQWEV